MHFANCFCQKSHFSFSDSFSYSSSSAYLSSKEYSLFSIFSPINSSYIPGVFTSHVLHLVASGSPTPVHVTPMINISSRLIWLSLMRTIIVFASHPFTTIAGFPSFLDSCLLRYVVRLYTQYLFQISLFTSSGFVINTGLVLSGVLPSPYP